MDGLSETPAKAPTGVDMFRAGAAETAAFVAAVNRTLADEAHVRANIAIFKEGVNLTSRLAIAKEPGWFNPLLRDLLGQGVSVVVNEIGLVEASCRAVERLTGIPANWVFQHNLYITPREVQGFVPHCDPHVVVVAHLYGRKEWIFYDKALDNPVITDDRSVLVADPRESLRVLHRFTVAPGDVFIIPRGRFHAACAHDGGSVHIAIGCAGVRPVDYIWATAGDAMNQRLMRADMSPADALQAAKTFLKGMSAGHFALPRNPAARVTVPDTPDRLSFEEVLDALPRG
jgi:hypothetical protein